MNGPSPRIVGIILLLIAALALFRTPYNASNLEIIPDSVEAAVGAQRFATLGQYNLKIDEKLYPPRYSPWFPTLVLAPFYLLHPSELGMGIIPVFILALVTVYFVFTLATRFGGPWAGAIAVVGLLNFSYFRFYSGEITTDIPPLAPILLAASLFATRPYPLRIRDLFLAGIAVAVAGAIRPTSFTGLFPFFFLLGKERDRKHLFIRLTSFLAPTAIVLIATAFYQYHAFGSSFRNGYQFWCPIPYDFPGLTFSLRYIPDNLPALGRIWMPMTVGGLGLLAAVATGHRPPRSLIIFTALTALPITAFHLLYFFPSSRFYLVLVLMLFILGSIGLSHLVPQRLKQSRWLLPLALLPIASIALNPPWDDPPLRRILTDRIAAQTPENAIIITNLDVVYLEPRVLRGTHRKLIPVSRKMAYAWQLVAWKKIHPATMPAGLHNVRQLGLKPSEASEVIDATADEIANQLADEALRGRPVFFAADLSFSPDPEFASICDAFNRRHLPSPRFVQ